MSANQVPASRRGRVSTHGSVSQIEEWFNKLNNWGRWGWDDELGTLNLITTECRQQAVSRVVDGVCVSCARTIDFEFGDRQTPDAPKLAMLDSAKRGEPGPPTRHASAMERIELVFHGYSITHLDSLAHYFWDGRMYNDRSAALVGTAGALKNAVTASARGIVGRGVLLDIAALHGKPWLEPGYAVGPEELEEAEAREGVRVESGDLVLLRTGYARRRQELGSLPATEGRAGWHGSCLPWLRARDVSVIGSDGVNDARPSGFEGVRSPLHAVGIVSMGLWLIDNCDLEQLSSACSERAKWDFLLNVAPLRLAGATGSPVNPIAVL